MAQGFGTIIGPPATFMDAASGIGSDVISGATSWLSPASAISNVTGFVAPASGASRTSIGVFIGTLAVPLVLLSFLKGRSRGRRR